MSLYCHLVGVSDKGEALYFSARWSAKCTTCRPLPLSKQVSNWETGFYNNKVELSTDRHLSTSVKFGKYTNWKLKQLLRAVKWTIQCSSTDNPRFLPARLAVPQWQTTFLPRSYVCTSRASLSHRIGQQWRESCRLVSNKSPRLPRTMADLDGPEVTTVPPPSVVSRAFDFALYLWWENLYQHKKPLEDR